MSDNSFNFRRLTDPMQMAAEPTAQKFDVPAGFFQPGGPAFGAMSFWICNPNNFWVRLKGSNGTYVAVTDTTGWLFPPGFCGSFSTQYPEFMSVMSVSRQGIPAGSGALEISYGGGS